MKARGLSDTRRAGPGVTQSVTPLPPKTEPAGETSPPVGWGGNTREAKRLPYGRWGAMSLPRLPCAKGGGIFARK